MKIVYPLYVIIFNFSQIIYVLFVLKPSIFLQNFQENDKSIEIPIWTQG